jgi:hypothetical protein
MVRKSHSGRRLLLYTGILPLLLFVLPPTTTSMAMDQQTYPSMGAPFAVPTGKQSGSNAGAPFTVPRGRLRGTGTGAPFAVPTGKENTTATGARFKVPTGH